MNKEEIIKKGWKDLGEQKIKFMWSFTKGIIRMNIYKTTNTVTFQDIRYKISKPKVLKNMTQEKLNRILN